MEDREDTLGRVLLEKSLDNLMARRFADTVSSLCMTV